MRRLLSVLLATTTFACVPGDRNAPPRLSVAEIQLPAPEGSGEPYLSTSEDGVWASWIERRSAGGHDVRVARLGPEGWGEPHTVSSGDDFFVNWADFPSVVEDAGGRLWSHWLQRVGEGSYAYGVRISRSDDGGLTWSDPWTPHEDGTATEHGFVTLFPWGGGVGITWLDGRQYAAGPSGEAPTREMTVRFREAGGAEGPGPEVLLDRRACDCCQTDVAVAEGGPVLVYRNRSAEEVRDIHVARWTPEGWTEGHPVHDDGWVIAGCPVNGPAVAARSEEVVVAWFTGADDEPRVQAAFSADGGETFGLPIRVDAGNPAGRVDVRLVEDGTAVVSWLERGRGERADLRLARVDPSHGVLATGIVSQSSSARASGFPRMALLPWDPDGALLAWTDVSDPERSRIRVVRVELPR